MFETPTPAPTPEEPMTAPTPPTPLSMLESMREAIATSLATLARIESLADEAKDAADEAQREISNQPDYPEVDYRVSCAIETVKDFIDSLDSGGSRSADYTDANAAAEEAENKATEALDMVEELRCQINGILGWMTDIESALKSPEQKADEKARLDRQNEAQRALWAAQTEAEEAIAKAAEAEVKVAALAAALAALA
jgi:hypothetical protein